MEYPLRASRLQAVISMIPMASLSVLPSQWLIALGSSMVVTTCPHLRDLSEKQM